MYCTIYIYILYTQNSIDNSVVYLYLKMAKPVVIYVYIKKYEILITTSQFRTIRCVRCVVMLLLYFACANESEQNTLLREGVIYL